MAQNNAKPLRRGLQSSHSNPTRLQPWTVFGSYSPLTGLHQIFPCCKQNKAIQTSLGCISNFNEFIQSPMGLEDLILIG